MRRKRLTGFLLALLIAAVLFEVPRASADPLYFAVINTKPYEFDSWYRPWLSGDNMMISHLVLTDPYNHLGLNYEWSVEDKYFTVYNSSRMLTFAYNQGTAFSGTERYSAVCHRVPGDGEMVFYLPAEFICEVFGFKYSTYDTEWGTMVRIRDSSVMMDDARLVKGRSTLLQDYYNQYYNIAPTPATPTPVVPAPSQQAAPSVKPSPSQPSPSQPQPSAPEPIQEPVSLTLTFDGASNSVTGGLLDLLEREAYSAIFFMPPGSIADDPAMTRRITACHQAGLLLDGVSGEEMDSIISEGNTSLRETAFVKTWLMRSDNAPSEPSGYRFWGYTLRFSEDNTAEEMIAAVEPLLQKTPTPSAIVLSFPHSEAALEALEELIDSFAANETDIRRVNPGDIPPV